MESSTYSVANNDVIVSIKATRKREVTQKKVRNLRLFLTIKGTGSVGKKISLINFTFVIACSTL